MLIRAHTNGVPVSIAKLEKSIAVLVIQGGSRWLVARDQDEALTILKPLYILNHALEDRDVLALTTSKDLYILQTVLAIVALA